MTDVDYYNDDAMMSDEDFSIAEDAIDTDDDFSTHVGKNVVLSNATNKEPSAKMSKNKAIEDTYQKLTPHEVRSARENNIRMILDLEFS